MKCEACGNDMVWEGNLRGGYMVCWHCRSLDIAHALNDPEPYPFDENPVPEYNNDYGQSDDQLKEVITLSNGIAIYAPSASELWLDHYRYMK